jgi:hypothetical protein
MPRQELDSLSTALESSAAFDTADLQLAPFEVVVYGMCALVLVQSLFSFGDWHCRFAPPGGLERRSVTTIVRRSPTL